MALGKHLSHHQHSGRLLPHHHTSYFGLAILVFLLGVVLAVFSAIRVNALTITQSGSINVSGIVYGPPPTVPATILVPSDGDTADSSTITVSGTCGPGLLVKLFRNGTLAGSTICAVDGTFSLQISLLPGTNVLRARNYDFQDQAGPDSPDVTVFYRAPTPTPTSSTSGSGANQAQPAVQGLIITSPYVYKSVEPNNSLEWPFDITGGQAPFAVLIDWGDGETSLLSIKEAGRFTAKHIYRKSGTYKVAIKVTDALGNKATLEVVAQASGVSALPQITQKPRFYDQVLPLLLAWPLYIFLALLVTSFWLGEKYYQHRIFAYLQTKKSRRLPARLAI